MAGSFFYANGDIYAGEWKDGKKHGEGTYFVKASASKLVGTYEEGELVHGSFTDSFGSEFNGAFTYEESGKLSYSKGVWSMVSGATAFVA